MGAPEIRLAMQARALLRHRVTGVSVSVIRNDVSGEREPQAVWWALEDLWLRLAQVCPVTVDRREPRITVHGPQRWIVESADQGELRAAALEPGRYRCDVDGRVRSFVRSIEIKGDDLVLQLMPPSVVERWPQGPELAQQVRGFLVRLEQNSRGVR